MISFIDAVKTCMTKKYATITGRATRAEFWWFTLFVYLGVALLVTIGVLLGQNDVNVFFYFVAITVPIFYLSIIIPFFCVRIRRFHDAGYSGWYMLLGLIPYIGIGILLYYEIHSSDADNEYGPSPIQSTSTDEDL